MHALLPHLLLAQIPPAGSSSKPTDYTWLLVAFALLAGSYLLLRPKMRAANKRKDPLESPPRSSLAHERGVERQMQNLLVELSEMSRQISAQLDTRAAKLEALIKEADEKIAQLKSLPAPHRAPSSSFEIVPAASPEPEEPNIELPEPPDPRYTEVYRLADLGRSPHEIAQQLTRPAGEVELILALRPRPRR